MVWNATDTKVLLSWEQVRAMENESEVTGYKVSCPWRCVLCKGDPASVSFLYDDIYI